MIRQHALWSGTMTLAPCKLWHDVERVPLPAADCPPYPHRLAVLPGGGVSAIDAAICKRAGVSNLPEHVLVLSTTRCVLVATPDHVVLRAFAVPPEVKGF